ncbi:hypothetical protein DsansV1_C32g0219761 [Dioscorea sansibarensis]
MRTEPLLIYYRGPCGRGDINLFSPSRKSLVIWKKMQIQIPILLFKSFVPCMYDALVFSFLDVKRCQKFLGYSPATLAY